MPLVETTEEAERPLMPALARGVQNKCPSCGEGRLFHAFLKTVDRCGHCGEALHHHRADDLPPYLAILIVGHILVGLMIHLDMAWHISPMTYLMIMLPLGIALPLVLLQPIKGMVVGLQWSRHMHGFGAGRDPALPDDH